MAEFRTNDQIVEFVSNWRNRARSLQKRNAFISIVSSIVAFALCVMLHFAYQDSNYERIVDQNMKYVQDSALQEANKIEAELRNVETIIANLSHQYAILEERAADTSISEKLTLLRDTAIFDDIGFVTPDGRETDLEGEIFIADRPYFQKALEGESGYEFIDHSRLTNRTAVVFYAPVVLEGETIGVMVGYREQQKLDELFSYTVFNFEPSTYLFLSDGAVVAHSRQAPERDNIFALLSAKSFIGATDFSDIRAVIADPQRTSINFSYLNGKDTMVGVIVQFARSDWMIFSILPGSVTSAMLTEANHHSLVMLASLVTIFTLLIGVLIFFLRKQWIHLEREMSLTAGRFLDTVKKDKRQLSIIESLGRAYSSVYYIDLGPSTYLRITERESSTNRFIPGEGDAAQGFDFYINHFVDEAFRADMHRFVDVTTFPARVDDNVFPAIEYQRKDKGWRRAYLVPAEKDENGRLSAVVFAVQRIDAEKQKELDASIALRDAYSAAQVASRAKTAFLSNMSHDIRTPMNAIIGMTTIANANLDNPEKVAGCLTRIESAGKHLLGLINEVLDMSKIESGNVDLAEEEFSLSDLIDTLISLNQPQIRARNHSLIVNVSHLPHEKVIGDSVRLQQVFTNLLSNAIKYTPDNGAIEISLTEKSADQDTVGWYEMIFHDNGIGMSEEFQKTLFEPFSRADDQRIAQIQGTGLGMSIARNIIRMMNGDITVKSQLNRGTTFTVTFALRLQTALDPAQADFQGLRVLVVDDDLTCCESACEMLNGLGMASEWVRSGAEALDLIDARHRMGNDYYAVIVDWKMPGLDGVETARRIRACTGDQLPVIIFSAYDWLEIEQKARAAGVSAFLSKPLFKSRVIALFSDLLGRNPREGDTLDAAYADYRLSGKRILLVEDNEMNREIATELLSMAGLCIETAENGKIAIDMFHQSAPGYYDLILMDIQMPVMNGYDATAAIRALSHPDARTIPIIAMTANAFSSDVRLAMQAGMNGHIAKPIDVHRVLKMLRDHIQQ